MLLQHGCGLAIHGDVPSGGRARSAGLRREKPQAARRAPPKTASLQTTTSLSIRQDRALSSWIALTADGNRAPRDGQGWHHRPVRSNGFRCSLRRCTFVGHRHRPIYLCTRDVRTCRTDVIRLLELNDRDPLDIGKAALAKLLRGAKPGIKLSEHIHRPGPQDVRTCLQAGL